MWVSLGSRMKVGYHRGNKKGGRWPNVQSSGCLTLLPVNLLPVSGDTTTDGIPSTTKNIVTGLYIFKPPSTSYTGINLSSTTVVHLLGNYRVYYSQIMLDLKNIQI